MNNISFGLKGIVTAGILDGGRLNLAPVVTRNLWLNQGLNNIHDHPICGLFDVAVKGTGTRITTEDLTGTANTYSIANNGTIMTRAAGTRDFTSGDVGKLFRFVGGKEFYITLFTDATHVGVSPAASPALTGVKGTFYGVDQVEMQTEIERSNTYSAVTGENFTSTAANVRTFNRTFVFGAEDTNTEVVPVDNLYSQTGTTVTREDGTRDFTAQDEGKTLLFKNSGKHAIIVTALGTTTVTVDTTQDNDSDIITLTADSELSEVVTGTYSRSTTTVTRVTGARDFTVNDVGKIMYFTTDDVEAIITVFTDATHVTVDTSGTLAAQDITLYGFRDYQEIGFSHSDEQTDNLNIRVLLSSAVRAYRSTPLQASDQLKVTYQCTLTVEPDTDTAGTLAGVIVDPGNAMSANKTGRYCIENFATSTVQSNGMTSVANPDLEPYYEGYAGLALNFDDLTPLAAKVRSTSLVTVAMQGNIYVDDSFTRLYTGLFDLNKAINDRWRSLMIVDPDTQVAAFTYLFANPQIKDGEHNFTIRFRKTWGRDLS